MVEEGPPSMLRVNVRRALTSGRFFLVYGTVIGSLLGVALALSGPSTFSSTFPTLLPIFGVVGSMGALLVFTNDRQKGVLEYLLAYGSSPRRIFTDVLLTALVLESIVLSVAIALGVGVFAARHGGVPESLTLLLVAYTIPMAYASAAFAAMLGMFWTSLSSPRMGMNSPIGLIPLIGILPSFAVLGALVVLGVAGYYSPDAFVEVALGAVVTIFVVVLVLLRTMGRFLRRESLLSPA